MSSCPRCASPVDPGDRFCMDCGRRLDEEAVDPTGGSDGAAAPDPVEAPAADVTGPVEPAPSPTPELVACPSCGSSNAARRARCGRCGATLRPGPDRAVDEEGEVEAGLPPALPLPPDDHHDHADGHRGLGSGIGIGVVVLGLVLGTGLGLAAGLRIGPFEPPAVVAFDELAYPGPPSVLPVAQATATSTADPAAGRSFAPAASIDGDLATAWAARTDEADLQHTFVEPVWVGAVEVAAGDQADEAAFARRGRPTRLRIDLGTLVVDAELADVAGVQVVTLPSPVLLDRVTLGVSESVGGAVAVSEVRYVGWSADDEDVAAFEDG